VLRNLSERADLENLRLIDIHRDNKRICPPTTKAMSRRRFSSTLT